MAGRGRGYWFHGAYKLKRDAERKEAATPGGFIRLYDMRGGRRWLVMSPRRRRR